MEADRTAVGYFTTGSAEVEFGVRANTGVNLGDHELCWNGVK